ncbi:MAG: hypothetical protein KDC88_13085 [Ignavibacteriae bacterium]|nr:hypothetical protein [Ignavibacteriota bacterium]MCB9210789.1 hypothetical protein [Ignavibacteriales bacterium]MCB9260066.1 hypothetical protein [Ignavibacteriales bacterium]
MFQNSSGELITKTIKDENGIGFELQYIILLNSNEIKKLKEYRENYAKTCPIHFNFNEGHFSFSKKKFFKKNQFVDNPPKLSELEAEFLDEIKHTLNRYKNLLHFDQIESLEKNSKISVPEILKRN